MSKSRFSYAWAMDSGYEWPYFLHYLLPQLEQSAYYEFIRGEKFDLQNPWADPNTWMQNPTNVNGVGIPTLMCPSDSRDGAFKNMSFSGTSSGLMMPASNYLGFFSGLNDWDNCKLGGNGVASDGNPGTTPSPSMRGLFRYNKGTAAAEVLDGLSNTMAVAEYLTGLDASDSRGMFYTNRAGSQFLYVTMQPNSKAGDNLLSWHASFCPTDGSHNRPSQNLPCNPSPTDQNYASPRSKHAGGVQVVFCDGSVHFMSNNINLQTWRNLGWIADGGVVNGGDYLSDAPFRKANL